MFRFQGSQLKQGQRYWYYYMIDGYHISHDPARESVTEPTTGRKLNILDIPSARPPDPHKAQAQAHAKRQSTASLGHTRRHSAQVPKGRSLSPSQIQSPLPTKPHATSLVVQERFTNPTVEVLSARLAATDFSEGEDSSDSESDSGRSDYVPSLTNSRSSYNSSPSSVSSLSSSCTCQRYGITRTGERVKLDCGGLRCASPADGSECSSESDNESRYRTHMPRRPPDGPGGFRLRK